MYPPLEHAALLLVRDGWRVFVVGELADTEQFVFPADPAIDTTAIKQGRGKGFLRQGKFLLRILSRFLRVRPSLLYVSDPLACPASSLLMRMFSGTTLYHEHDSPMPEETTDPPLPRRMKAVLQSRARVSKRATVIVIPHPKRSESFDSSLRSKTTVVLNCPLREEIDERPTMPSSEDDFSMVYQGSLVPDRLPLSLLTAMASVPRQCVLGIIGYETLGHRGYLQEVLTRASDLGLERRIRYVGSPSRRADLLKLTSQFDLGLALVPSKGIDFNMQTMEGASNKPFDYLARGVPVLVSSTPGWEDMFVEPGYGLSCVPEDPESIVEALLWFTTHPEERLDMAARGRRKITQSWNYETQFAPVLSALRRSHE